MSNDIAKNEAAAAASAVAQKTPEEYEQEIAALQQKLKAKELEVSDMKQGLEAQIHMVMELEELEQNELREYEKKLEANRKVIDELGERVGNETKAKAELQSKLNYLEQQCHEQTVHIGRLEELASVNADLLRAAKDDTHNNHLPEGVKKGGQWEIYKKLEQMMATNSSLVEDLARNQDELHAVRKDVSDKELLALELSVQLDKLASQLNTADEDMAAVQRTVQQKDKELAKAKDRVQMLEKSLLDDQGGKDATKGAALLMRRLKDKEEQYTHVLKERDASLAKATKLSLALAASREHQDALQEKLDYQNSIVDRILGKARPSPGHRSASMSRIPSIASPSAASPATPAKPVKEVDPNAAQQATATTAGEGTFVPGRRIRNFFRRHNSSDGGIPTTSNNKNRANSHDDTKNHLQKKASGGSTGSVSQKEKDNSNPFDDHSDNDAIANNAVGKQHQIDEDVQDGGGEFNLVLSV